MTLEPAYQSLTAQLREVNTKFEIRGNGGIFPAVWEISSHEESNSLFAFRNLGVCARAQEMVAHPHHCNAGSSGRSYLLRTGFRRGAFYLRHFLNGESFCLIRATWR